MICSSFKGRYLRPMLTVRVNVQRLTTIGLLLILALSQDLPANRVSHCTTW